MIILTKEQADDIRGLSQPGHELEPALLKDGVTYVLPEEVLEDVFHEQKWPLLSGLPTRHVAANEWPYPTDPDDDNV